MRDVKIGHALNPRTSGDAVLLVCCSRIAPRIREVNVRDLGLDKAVDIGLKLSQLQL
jgi:hypothetical protein